CPDETVICLAGDGSLIMVCQEMATAAEHDLDVKVMLMNNGHFGMVRQWQELFWEERYQSVKMGHSPDWVALAQAFGWTAAMVDDKASLADAMRTTIETPGPALLDVRVTQNENCYPMIPAGAAARDMVG
ncbi:MAG TPA: thiamine pyrophosphate-dependent enzyme, partial [Solirubrobacterales bacterium]|nr:thiamine pyrophosphate-dependent enzyme [Solirubrobacterales bacterium]